MEHAALIDRLEAALYDLDETGVEIVSDEHFLRFTQPKAATHFRNGVLRSVFAPDDAEIRIEATIAHFDALGLPFRWVVTPSARPIDTAARLRAHGFEHFETLYAMVANPADFPPPRRADIDVVEVDEATLEAWVEVCRDAWELPPEAVPVFREQARRGIRKRPRADFYYLARLDGTPASSAALCLIDDFAHFGGASTRSAFRHRGLYRELIFARMQALRGLGIDVVTNHCVSTTSAPICAKLGFKRICDFEVFVHQPPDAS